MELIRYENVSVAYERSVNVLENISFTIDSGTVTVLLGANGSGKSTLMSTMNKLIKPASGKIYIDGVDTDSLSVKEIARRIAFVPQMSESSFSFSVEEAILWGRAPYISYLPRKEDKLIVDDVIKRLRIEHLRKKSFSAISGGERQMVLVARALAQQAPIVLMDEPATYLDLYNQSRILNVIKDINVQDKVTFIVTLHDPNHAMYIADNVMMIKDKKAEIGTREEMMTSEKLCRLYSVPCEIHRQGEKTFVNPDYAVSMKEK